jgi:phosphoribosylformimino-5-aminoimidazole carboxamide ribonucleotide (ProFAR) isomerase
MSKAYPNLVGAIVGKALYEGRCDVQGLLAVTRGR